MEKFIIHHNTKTKVDLCIKDGTQLQQGASPVVAKNSDKKWLYGAPQWES